MKESSRLAVVICFALGVVASGARPSWGQQRPSLQGPQPTSGQQGQAPGTPRVTPQQVKDAQAIQNELDPDKQIQMVNDFVAMYPESPYLSDIYFYGAYAAQRKGDVVKVVDFGEKSLKANNDNMRTLILMASILPRPQVAQGAEAEKRLAEAEADANRVLQMLPQLSKPANQTDEQFQQAKSAISAEVHAALGMVHLMRAPRGLTGSDAEELSKSEKEYQIAVSAPNPNAEDYFRLGEAYAMDNKTDRAIEAFTKASQLSRGTSLQTYADQKLKAMREKEAPVPTFQRQVAPLGLKATPPVPQHGPYYALIIGINQYRYLNNLETAVGDAEAVARTLHERYGFETKVLLNGNASRYQIISALAEYRRTLPDNASLLIYYAGHGHYDTGTDKAYWLPADAGREDPANWIIADDITSEARAMPARHVLIISDSCYSGGITRDANLDVGVTVREHTLYIEKMLAGKSRLLMSSGGNEPVADRGAPGHSVFAYALLQGLGEMDENGFSAEELFQRFIREQVAGRSEQVPGYNIIRNSGHEQGDFVFFRLSSVKAPQAPQPRF